MTKHENGLFIFTRDLRLTDNIGLNRCASECRNVYTVFFFTPEQVSNANSFKSSNAIQFMIESLNSLQTELRSHGGGLTIIYSEPEAGVKRLLSKHKIDSVYINQEITKYGRERFDALKSVCDDHSIPITETNDYYLTSPDSITNSSGNPYVKFTPYYNKVVDVLKSKSGKVPKPTGIPRTSFRKFPAGLSSMNLTDAMKRFGGKGSPQRVVSGGRQEGLSRLRKVKQVASDYEATRNNLEDNTTMLSAYIKFGAVSIREVYYAFQALNKKAADSLTRQLIWRDFYAQVMFHYPDVLFGPMREQYSKIKWTSSTRLFDAWKTGTTGFPIVDAAMRELAATGYMHNRARLIAGSFLPKTLLVNWQKGEKFFAQSLTDYDPASNNGNWQWVAGTGSDSQPYFRILNPFLQSKKYDVDATYIKRWVPELASVPPKDIHSWDTASSHYDLASLKYPKPIVDYATQKEKVLSAYKAV